MADEFSRVMKGYSEAPLKERVEGLADVIEKIMAIVLKIPEMTDNSIGILNSRIVSLESRLSSIESKLSDMTSKGVVIPGMAPSGSPPPPPPPGKPGAPPPPPGKAPAQAAANPMSLRGSIMDELKSLFSKRKSEEE